jgi:hypothetical protein
MGTNEDGSLKTHKNIGSIYEKMPKIPISGRRPIME